MTPLTEADRDARDAAIQAILPHVPTMGWTPRAVSAGLQEAGMAAEDAAYLFPRGAVSAVEAWLDLIDREMVAEAGDLSAERTPGRIRALIAARLRLAAPHKEAVRQGVALLALPCHAARGVATAARSASAIWYAAGDRSSDFSWYTRRASLATIYGATLAYWLRDDSADLEPALDFLDRRLEGLARAMRWRRRLAPRWAA